MQTLLGDGGAAVRRAYIRAGVLALLFGKAFADATCACDDDGDGKDDDGGLFKRLAGALPPLRVAGGRTARPSRTAPVRTTAPSVVVKAAAVRRSVTRGATARLVLRLTSREAAQLVVAVQLYAPGAGTSPTYQVAFRGQRLRAGVPRRYGVAYRVPAAARAGRWTVKVGLFDPSFRRLLVWRPGGRRLRRSAEGAASGGRRPRSGRAGADDAVGHADRWTLDAGAGRSSSTVKRWTICHQPSSRFVHGQQLCGGGHGRAHRPAPARESGRGRNRG